MKTKIRALLMLLIAISLPCLAMTSKTHACKVLTSFTTPLPIQKIQRCQQQISTCIPKNQRLPQADCVNKLQQLKICQPLLTISRALKNSLSQTKAAKIGSTHYTLITNTATADGIQRFFMLTPQQKLFSLAPSEITIDQLKKNLNQPSLILVAQHQPRLSTHKATGSIQLIAFHQLRTGCIACRSRAQLKTFFIFDQNSQCKQYSIIQHNKETKS